MVRDLAQLFPGYYFNGFDEAMPQAPRELPMGKGVGQTDLGWADATSHHDRYSTDRAHACDGAVVVVPKALAVLIF